MRECKLAARSLAVFGIANHSNYQFAMNLEVEKSSICTMKISGGMGNQLFQYAAGRAMSLRTGADLALDTSFYARKRHRTFELSRFPLASGISLFSGRLQIARKCREFVRHGLRKEPVYREPHFHYDNGFESLQTPIKLEGYFQSHRYFEPFSEAIRSELEIPQPDDDETRRLAEQIRNVRATTLHIRRGDYVTNSKASQIFAQCTVDYYHRAMEMIPGDASVYVFSDDLAWAKKNLRPIKPLVFAEGETRRSGLADFWLMSQGHDQIIGNSTFSWWAAWLSDTDRGMTVAPRKWFVDPAYNDQDLIPADWIRL